MCSSDLMTTGSLSSMSLSDLDSSSDQGLRFFTFLAGVPLGVAGFLGALGAPARTSQQTILRTGENERWY